MDQRNSQGKPHRIYGIRLTGKGRREIGRWPTDEVRVVDELITRLEELIEVANPEQRTRLQRALVAVRGISRDGAISLGAAWLAAAGL